MFLADVRLCVFKIVTVSCCRYNAVTTKHLNEFSEQGLRTLCLAFREISAEEVSHHVRHPFCGAS